MKFKTNAKCGGCTSAILKAIDSLAPASAWEFDLASPDKTLTYVGDAPAPDASSVMSAIEKAGFKESVLS